VLAGFAGLAHADLYDVTVDTSAITGTVGSLDFNFNPGPLLSQDASAQILNFTTDGTLAGSPVLTGDVSGALPSTLTFDNGTGFNDYFDGFTFGSTLSFQLSPYGPAVSSPDGFSTSGSAFGFSMFSDPGGTVPVLTTDTTDGFAFTTSINLDGTTTVTGIRRKPVWFRSRAPFQNRAAHPVGGCARVCGFAGIATASKTGVIS